MKSSGLNANVSFLNNLKKILKENPLIAAVLAGICFTLILSCTLVFFLLNRDTAVFPFGSGASFFRDLARYDNAIPMESPEQLDRRLDRLERHARSQEEWLSLLKRRRNLAFLDSGFLLSYQTSGREAVKLFPHSEIMAVIAGESLLLDSAPDAVMLKNYAGQISGERYAPLVLSYYALSGVLNDPAQTAQIPEIERLLSIDKPPQLVNLLATNNILLRILNRERSVSAIEINELIRLNPASRVILGIGAEFFYDYGMPLRAAELFAALGESHINRIADALALAGQIPAARNIWTALASPQGSVNPEQQIRSIFNLAATSANEAETLFWLERIFSSTSGTETIQLYGILMYTRLFNASRSIAILEDQELQANPILDLEYMRRMMETWPLDRSTAEVWLILGRHPESENIYQWASWYFNRQGLYSESIQLARVAGQHEILGSWFDLAQALSLIQQRNTNEGYRILENIYESNPYGDWRVPANMARVLEGRRSINAALDYYQRAAALADTNQNNAILQFRISRCLDALGRNEESRRAIEYAFELDPENFDIKMEIRRLEMPWN